MGENEEMRIMGNDSGKCYSVSVKRCKGIMQSVKIKVCYVGFESIKVDAKNKNENKRFWSQISYAYQDKFKCMIVFLKSNFQNGLN